MVTRTLCDGCNEPTSSAPVIIEADGPTAWFGVERLRLDVCGWACLAKWAGKYAKDREPPTDADKRCSWCGEELRPDLPDAVEVRSPCERDCITRKRGACARCGERISRGEIVLRGLPAHVVCPKKQGA